LEAAVLGFIIGLAIVGLIVGFIARALVPGPDPMGILGTICIGLTGSFVGGFLLEAITRADGDKRELGGPGLIGSVIGAIIVLLIYRAMSSRSTAR
jgi:uncharacterized membrane protein YeaQ/YmgE (transglycosylase-associated protein family)